MADRMVQLMKGSFFLGSVFILLGVFLSSFFFQRKERIPVPVQSSVLSPPFISLPLQMATVNQQRGIGLVNRLPSQSDDADRLKKWLPYASYTQKPDGNIIEFEVVNGLAIAYGDVLLGTPEIGFEGNRGLYEAQTPQLWEHAEIPYLIHPDLPNPKRVEIALDYFRQNTPVRFVPYRQQKDALIFEVGTEHCYSFLGRMGGLQPIKLAEGCQSQEILHEIMHALGFVHEQSRSDRDLFIEILWEQIEQKYQLQFAMVPDSFLEALRGASFDYHSIMLYPQNSFAIRPDLQTMRSIGSDVISPVKVGLSTEDQRRVNRLYSFYER